MRTGTRFELGGWTMSYYGEEYADHGRPFGAGSVGSSGISDRSQDGLARRDSEVMALRRSGVRGRPLPACFSQRGVRTLDELIERVLRRQLGKPGGA